MEMQSKEKELSILRNTRSKEENESISHQNDSDIEDNKNQN
jgi:hypothetical protein